MANDILVSGDTGPAITGYIHERGSPNIRQNLTNATVKFQMRRERDRELMIDGAAVIVDPASGVVSYTLEPNDTAIPGEYVYQWQVTFPDGKKQTTYAVQGLTIRRR